MAIVDDFAPSGPARAAGRPRFKVLRSGWAAFTRGLAAGWRAAAEHRHLSEMSDRQLRWRGLARSDIPTEIHRRHFAGLRGGRGSVD